MASNVDQIQQMMDNSTMLVSDAASMFRYPITRNMKPYDKAVTEGNNKLVDEWHNSVLKKIGLQGRIAAGKVGPSWATFYEGKTVRQLGHHFDMLPRATQTQLDFWTHFFETKTIEELHASGLTMVSIGWALIMNELRLYAAQEKYDHVYHDEDPLEWDKESAKHRDLMEGKKMPFWDVDKFRDIQEKVMTILNLRVIPRNI